MSELFGLSMNAIMVVLLVLFGACLAVFVGVFFGNRTMFRMGVRNARRRRAQSSLVIAGLMLATVIITAAFSTGDAIDYSATSATYDNLERTDLSLHHFRSVAGDGGEEEGYVPEGVTAVLEEQFRSDRDIEGFMPFLYEAVPVLNTRTRLSEPTVVLTGFDADRLERFGGLQLLDGTRVELQSLADDEVLVGERIADKVEAVPGDPITVFAAGQQATLKVAAIVKDERASGALEFGPAVPVTGMAAKLSTVQRITGHEGAITTVNVALRGGVRGSIERSDPAAARLEEFRDAQGLPGQAFQVETIKQDAVDGAKLAGSIFTTVFLVLGLFSIAAGVMLIFTLFVMLAAERRTEMGIARAVGAQRSHLVQAFVAEGAVYDLLAGLIGVVLGVGAAIALVVGAKALVGEALSVMQPHITARSLVVSFCLGAVLTFLTVIVSSLRISQLNIVAAVRGESGQAAGPEGGRRLRWTWIAAGIPATIIPPLGAYFILRKGIGLPWGWIIGPVGIAFGALLVLVGGLSHVAFPYTLGVSLVILSAATLAQSFTARRRLAWSLAGAALSVFWLLPNNAGEAVFGEFENTGMEMFVLSGIMIVTGFTLIIVFNARLLTNVFAVQHRGARRFEAPLVLTAAALLALAAGVFFHDSAGGLGELGFLVAAILGIFALSSFAAIRVARLAPAFKMGVAYPLANRFRTGMTVSMFSIVVFSITVMGIINGSFLAMFTSDEGRGGWDIRADTNRNNPVADLPLALAESGFDAGQLTAVGRATQYDDNEQEAREPGGDWVAYPVIGGDDAFFREARMKLQGRAEGYDDDRAVYDAVRTTEGLAILDSAPLQSGGFGATGLSVGSTDISNGEFQPFRLEIRDKVTGEARTVTVVGILSAKIAPALFMGIFTNEATYRSILGEPKYQTMYVRLIAGADAGKTAKAMKAALVTSGVQAVSIQEEIDDAVSASLGFLRVFQAFMALGLFVGIASLGVIAMRSVVERRQQIGMLRAIGYQRGTVAMSFLLESGFIAMMGILSGVLGATLLSWRLIEGGEFTGTELGFFVPWTDIVIELVAAFAVALVFTWWPSRRAASVPIAEALRYE